MTNNRSQPLVCWGIRLPMSSTRSTRVNVRVWRHLFPPSSLRRPCVHRRTARRLPAPARGGPDLPAHAARKRRAGSSPARAAATPAMLFDSCSRKRLRLQRHWRQRQGQGDGRWRLYPRLRCGCRGTGDSGRDKATDDGDCIRDSE
jgi:hypothetical protein